MPEFRIQKPGDLAYVEGTGKWKGCLEDIGAVWRSHKAYTLTFTDFCQEKVPQMLI